MRSMLPSKKPTPPATPQPHSFVNVFGVMRSFWRSRLGRSIKQPSETQKALDSCRLIEQRHQRLEEAADQQKLLTSAEVAAILGCSPRSFSGQTSIKEFGFVISLCGRQGAQLLWRVSRRY